MEASSYTWLAVAGLALTLLTAWLARRWKGTDDVGALRSRLRAQLRLALAEGRISDAAALQRRLRALGCLAACLLLSAVMAGCRTPTPTDPLIIGERAFQPLPGAVLTVPPLIPPAACWYLVDDVFLAGWLGLDLEAPAKESVTK